ncbi:hypothetical protein LAX5112_00506 [Roseibium alexandrii]|uniref:Uncharacterized protein n=1 Tax=Roseibium alexandrii TaxID=388408 RepID=A0A0M6ZQN5_9HYPH|nr:hypothetical protein LAX5112_00506 [Roseibium alexandrii]
MIQFEWRFSLRGAVCPGQGAYLLRTGRGCKRLFELFLKVTPSCLFARSFLGNRGFDCAQALLEGCALCRLMPFSNRLAALKLSYPAIVS